MAKIATATRMQGISYFLLYFQLTWTFIPTTAADFCSNPKIAETMDVKWLHENHAEGWNIQFGSPKGRRHTAQLLHGRNISDTENFDYSNMCARVFIDFVDGVCSGQFNGFKGKRGDWKCQQKDHEFVCEFINYPNKAYSDPGKAYVSYFDGKDDHKIMVVIYCYESGGSGWQAQSRTKTISAEERKIMMDHVKTIGYDPNDSVTMFTESC